jgi:hypothetical protein
MQQQQKIERELGARAVVESTSTGRGRGGGEGVERSRAVHMNGFEIVSGSGTTVERFYKGGEGESWPYF